MALPTGGLVIQLDAHTIDTVLYNQGVGTWFDQSGHSNDATYDYASGSTAPVLRPNVTPNGSAAVQFANGSMWFGGAFPNPMFDSSTGAEIFIYVQIFSASADNSGLYQFGGNDNTYYTYVDGNVYDGSFTNSRYSWPAVTPTNWHVYNVSHDGTTRTTRIDGTTVHTVNTGFVGPSLATKNILRIGRNQGVPWQGYIAGVVAYSRALSAAERTQVYNFLATAYTNTPPASDPQLAQIPAAHLTVDMPVTYEDPLLVVPAAGLTIDLGLSGGGEVVIVPPAALSIGLGGGPASTSTLTLTAPAAGDTLRTSQPTFVVAVSVPDPTAVYTVEVQYDDNPAFTHPVTISGPVTAADGGAWLTATAAAAPATTYWRARLLLGTEEEVTWTTAATFTVDATIDATTLPVTWTVDTTADRPIHVWHLNPAGPLDGDTVTLYGQGFPATGSLTFGDTMLPTTSWHLVAATAADADDTTRVIEEDTVTPEHYEVQFVAPVDDGPGAALVLEA